MSVSKPDKGRSYDDALKNKALCLAGESRSTRGAAACQPGLSEKLFYHWPPAQAVAKTGSVAQAQNPACRAPRAGNQRLERETSVAVAEIRQAAWAYLRVPNLYLH